MDNLIFTIHAGATIFLVGLIWTIQIVHYPLFENVGAADYETFQNRHMSRITYVVAPVMLAELLTAAYFAWEPFGGLDQIYFWFGFAVVLMIWASTLFIQSPIHGQLAQAGLDGKLVKKLVLTNWIRTFLWTLRGILILWMIWLKIK